MDIDAINSGKGVIIGLDITDTYLNKQVANKFNKAWKK